MEEDKQLVEEGEIHEDDDDPDQDVPDDFFDDFNNEGFMESLQIVDSLDDGVEEPEVHDENEHVENNILKKSNDEKKTRKSEKSEKSRSKERKRRRESPRKKRKFDDTVLRRDPDKTRRDLEKDRVNFFKKKEQKVISKIIETGLVPPGMESEVNLSSIESERKIESEKSDQNKSDSNKIKSTPYKRSRERRSSVSKEMRISKERRNPISKERRSPDHRDRRSYISKDKRSPISKDRSPMSNDRKIRERRRNRSRSGSYGRYRSRSRERRRDRSPDLMRRRFRSSSRDRFDHLNRNKRRSRSISDRERWLRARDPSPEKKYEGLLKDKKISFLEEINMKLNGELGVARGDGVTYPQPKNPVQPPMVAPMPVAVPPPHFNQMYMMPQQSLVAPMNTTYNEEYFIGNQMMIPFKPNIPHMMPPLEHQSNLPVIQPTIPPGTPDMSHGGLEPPAEAVSSDTSEISARVSELIARISASTKSNLNQTGQLSQPVEKPLSLTDFLHINPAQECAPQPEALKKKIDVHCQTDKKTKDDGKEFECPQQVGNGNFADPANCRRFYQCVDGFPYVNRCPSGLYFDDISKLCTFKNEARCGPIATTPAPITEPPTDLAVKCNLAECELPYCFCSKDGTLIPGGLNADEIPQIILLTFDGAVNLNNFEHYQKVFNKKRQNPNGCDIKGTFFISHEYSNYQMVQKLASDGHEMATETISLQSGLQDKGYEEWVGEMIGMREILKHLSNVSKSEVVGMRAPFLKPGRNTQYKVIEDFGYIYDSSIGVPPSDLPVWPYTLDYKIPHECKSGTCPSKTFPGVWEVPLNEHYVKDFEGGHCPYLDQCVLHNSDAEEVFEWLQEDFSRYYEQNKAPYMMPFHTNWFSIKQLEKGLHKFLDWAATLPDVYFVTVTQALTWITDPKTLDQLNNYEPWDCQKKKENTPPPPCNIPNKCALNFKTPDMNFTDIRYLETCFECPKQYPWLGDAGGSGIPGKDNYIPDNVK